MLQNTEGAHELGLLCRFSPISAASSEEIGQTLASGSYDQTLKLWNLSKIQAESAQPASGEMTKVRI
jgi:WD40 repeat protein